MKNNQQYTKNKLQKQPKKEGKRGNPRPLGTLIFQKPQGELAGEATRQVGARQQENQVVSWAGKGSTEKAETTAPLDSQS